MADFLEDLDFNFNWEREKDRNKTSVLQMIDLAEKEGFTNLELFNVNFPDGIIFNRVQRLDKVQKIKIVDTNITTLANIPSNVNEILIKKGEISIANFTLISNVEQVVNISIINNKIKTILYLNLLKNLVYIDLSQNDITEIPQLPENVLTFIATHNKIKKIQNLNKNLLELNLSNNLISEFHMIPDCVESINISRNEIRIVDVSSFKKLKVFKAYNNRIKIIIGPISPYIEVFDVFNNELQKIPDLGLHIKEIDLSNNDFKVLPKFGTSVLERLDITRNPLLNLSNDEISMLMEINKLNKSLVVMCDQFDMPHNALNFKLSESSSSSEIDFSDIFDNDIKPVDESSNMRHFDIIELLNRNRHMHAQQESFNQPFQQINNQQTIIRGKQIYKRRTYEL